jgi:HSP20 family molecular chaperone IbpA
MNNQSNNQSTNFAQRSCTAGTFSQMAREQQQRQQQQRQQQQLGARGRVKAPSLSAELTESHEWMRLTLDLPGVQFKDIDVTINHGVLTIECGRRTMSVDGSVCVKKQKISRRYAIDTDAVDVHNATANLKFGVLTIKAPKMSKPNRVRLAVTENDEGLTSGPNGTVSMQPSVSVLPVTTTPYITAPISATPNPLTSSDEETRAIRPSLRGVSVKEEHGVVQPDPVINDPARIQ